tara:strand:- start:53 stop:316 length:264 start_codon:yes stop_codon:yes gene_type:complete
MKTTPIREKIYEIIDLYVNTPEPKKLCSSLEDLVEELAESKVKNLSLSGVSHQREQLIAYELHMLRSTEEKDRLYWAKKTVDKYLSN